MSDEDAPALTAVAVGETHGMRVEPADANRAWMNASPNGFARRCLPMLVANQHGWVLTSPVDVSVQWDGTSATDAIAVAAPPDTHPDALPVSHFGDGILTWRVPYLFSTPPDVNLLLRGPANQPKDGASPLEGLMESDWSPATGTMNWAITRPRHPITFRRGEPIGMIVPVPRGYLESFRPRLAGLADSGELAGDYLAWREDRTAFIEQLGPRERLREEWQGDYFRGQVADRAPSGAQPHQRKLRLRAFEAPTEG